MLRQSKITKQLRNTTNMKNRAKANKEKWDERKGEKIDTGLYRRKKALKKKKDLDILREMRESIIFLKQDQTAKSKDLENKNNSWTLKAW